MSSRDPHSICADCGYDLSGVDVSSPFTCPECGGHALRPSDWSIGEVVGSWIKHHLWLWIAPLLMAFSLLIVGLMANSYESESLGLLVGFVSSSMWLYYMLIGPLLVVYFGAKFAKELPREAHRERHSRRSVVIALIAAALSYAMCWLLPLMLAGFILLFAF